MLAHIYKTHTDAYSSMFRYMHIWNTYRYKPIYMIILKLLNVSIWFELCLLGLWWISFNGKPFYDFICHFVYVLNRMARQVYNNITILYMSIYLWNGNVIILMKFSSLAHPKLFFDNFVVQPEETLHQNEDISILVRFVRQQHPWCPKPCIHVILLCGL